MNYDCIIIGGGVSGLTCGIRCVSAGLSCAVISSGMSVLHFASGSIDLLGRYPDRKVVPSPFDYLPEFVKTNPKHPYAKCGIDDIYHALFFFRQEVAKQQLDLHSNGKDNHFHMTTFGTITPTYFSQKSVFNEYAEKLFKHNLNITIVNFEGFRDFHAPLIVANLSRHTLFKDRELNMGTIRLSMFKQTRKNPHEFRSIDISRLFETTECLEEIATQIAEIAGNDRIVGMPAVIGIDNHNSILYRLQEISGVMIYEIPTLPPSILGMRMDKALKSRFAELGGVFIAGDKVVGGEIQNGILPYIHTRNHGDTQFKARFFVLSTGSFLSGGLASEFDKMQEPVFNLAMEYAQDRTKWRARDFFHPESHDFLHYGVKTNEKLNPFTDSGQPVENIFCTGSVLSSYNPVKEGSGNGVAISTGFKAANRIIEECG